jgi:hypothetical protein
LRVRSVRITALIAAILACAWFVIGELQAVDTSRAGALVAGNRPVSAATAAHARSLLRSAAFLNPDTSVRLLDATVDLARGDATGARRIIVPVLREEPMNLDAWVALARASFHGSPYELQVAVHNIARLDPRG